MKSKYCLEARNVNKYEALCCLASPYPEEHDIYRIKTLVTFRGIEVFCSYFEQFGIRFYCSQRGYWIVKDSNVAWRDECPPTTRAVIWLLDREQQLVFLHSIFCQAMRRRRTAAAYAAGDAADAAADAAYDAYAADAADAAYAAADAVYAAARAAAADAADAVYAAADADAAAAKRKFIKMFKTLITYRKEVSEQ